MWIKVANISLENTKLSLLPRSAWRNVAKQNRFSFGKLILEKYVSRFRNVPSLKKYLSRALRLRDRRVFGYRASSVKSCLIPRSGWKEEGLPDSYVINEKTCRVTAAPTWHPAKEIIGFLSSSLLIAFALCPKHQNTGEMNGYHWTKLRISGRVEKFDMRSKEVREIPQWRIKGRK